MAAPTLPNYRPQPAIKCCASCIHCQVHSGDGGGDSYCCHHPSTEPLPVFGWLWREVEPTDICDSFHQSPLCPNCRGNPVDPVTGWHCSECMVLTPTPARPGFVGYV